MNHAELTQHMEWADALLFRAVQETPKALDDEELHQRLHHIHLVQRVFLQIWRGEDFVVREAAEFQGLGDLLAWARESHAGIRGVVENLEADRLEAELDLPWKDDLKERFGEIRPTHLGETLTQVVLHTAHHRGQVASRLRALGGEPPLTDYIAWVWQGRPAAEWPAAGPSSAEARGEA